MQRRVGAGGLVPAGEGLLDVAEDEVVASRLATLSRHTFGEVRDGMSDDPQGPVGSVGGGG